MGTGLIYGGASGPQRGLPELKQGDTITVAVNDGKLTFIVNGQLRGASIKLPPNTQVAMAVSLKKGAVRFTSQSPLPSPCPTCKGDETVCIESWKRRTECPTSAFPWKWHTCADLMIPCPDCPVKDQTPAVISAPVKIQPSAA